VWSDSGEKKVIMLLQWKKIMMEMSQKMSHLYDLNCPKYLKLSKPTDMTIYQKALADHFMYDDTISFSI
jgi:hypothetical protein